MQATGKRKFDYDSREAENSEGGFEFKPDTFTEGLDALSPNRDQEQRNPQCSSAGISISSNSAHMKSSATQLSAVEPSRYPKSQDSNYASPSYSPAQPKRFLGIRSFFGACFGQDMAMDLGTANTLIYVRGKGIVLNEPSVVAIREDDSRPVAVGSAAKEMYGKTSRHVRCVRPVKDGVIADFDITHLMIKNFITRVTNRWQMRRPRLIISVPSGITMVEKRAVVDAAIAAGARQVHLIDEPMAAAIGSGMEVNKCGGNMIVDIGGGTTEVAVISMGATSYAESVRIAGDEMDEAIELFIRRAFNLQIGIFEAERIKLTIGSAMPMKQPREMKIFGRDLASGTPREMIVDDAIIRRALKEPLAAIVDAVLRALERTSPELSADIIRKGIYLAGGGAMLAGLPERLSLESGLKFVRTADPLTAIVRGTGKVLEEYKEYKQVCIS